MKLNGILGAALFTLAASQMAACATVTRGSHQTWAVETDPAGAAVTTTNGFACDQTPCTFKMKRKAAFDVNITKPGFKAYHGRVEHQVATGGAAGMAGNVLVGGLIGAGVDATSGAMLELKPNPMVVKLEPEASAQTPASDLIAKSN
ncbi:MAG: PEGA domain-containing protein [Caulobacteraceae bacterium]